MSANTHEQRIKSSSKPRPQLADRRRQRARTAVIAAARRLLAGGEGESFTMRDLAEAAGLSLVTPYKHFGSKSGVLRAVVDQSVADITERFKRHPFGNDPLGRVMTLAEIGADVLLEDRDVIRPAGRALMINPSGAPGPTLADQATQLWQLAIQADFPFREEAVVLGAPVLARQLAVMFRGMMAFWISGEVDDKGFRSGVVAGATTMILAFAEPRKARAAVQRLIPDGSRISSD